MRPALFLSALLATALIGGTALAERTNDDDHASKRPSSARELKERVLQERGQRHESTTTNDRGMSPTQAAQAQRQFTFKADKFRAKGDVYESYGDKHTSGITNQANDASKQMAKSKLNPGQSKGEQVDGSTRSKNQAVRSSAHQKVTYKSKVDGSQNGWSAGGKSVRSFVHFTNDKGQVNNQIRGATPQAMKIRHVAHTLMKSAGTGLIKVFAFETAGGDGQSLFPGN